MSFSDLRVHRSSTEVDFLSRLWGDSLPTAPTYMSVADCIVAGPMDSVVAEEILTSPTAIGILRRAWTEQCPNLSLLAAGAVPEGELDDQTGEPTWESLIGEILALAHTARCVRCREIMRFVAAVPHTRARLRSVPADQWSLIGGGADLWAILRVEGGLLLTGPDALDGHPVVLVDLDSAGTGVQVLTVPLSTRGALFITTDKPDRIEIHHNRHLNSEVLTLEDELWLVAHLTLGVRDAIRGADDVNLGAELRGHVADSDVEFSVGTSPRRGKWSLQLRGLDPKISYQATLLWADGKSSTEAVPAGLSERRVLIAAPNLQGLPIGVVLHSAGASES